MTDPIDREKLKEHIGECLKYCAICSTALPALLEANERLEGELAEFRDALYPHDSPEDRAKYPHSEMVVDAKEFAFAHDKLAEVLNITDERDQARTQRDALAKEREAIRHLFAFRGVSWEPGADVAAIISSTLTLARERCNTLARLLQRSTAHLHAKHPLRVEIRDALAEINADAARRKPNVQNNP